MRNVKTEAFPPPARGWLQSGNIAQAPLDAAEVLDNYIPTAQGARLRGGMTEYADLGTSLVRLWQYTSGGVVDMFGASSSKVWDADRVAVGGSNAFGDVEGLSSGDWSSVQIGTSAGQYCVAVNGADHGMYWDGSEWNPITTVAVNDVGFDAETAAFSVGETVSDGTASATILQINKSSTTAGTLKVGTITSGPFTDNNALTSAGGAATANGASAAASAITITGVSTSDLSQVWLFKERLFFVEKDTTSAWYLPTDSIGGAATELPLRSVFKKGGSLLFGASWSLDSGDGLDDVCIFVSTEGEIAVYEGTDPASASTWALRGVYEVGAPVDKHSHFKAGGDLVLLTEDGMVPVSGALVKDRAALQAAALTYPIEDAWKDAIADRSVAEPISAVLWQSKTLLLVGTPSRDDGKDVCFVANARTGAWGRITGWDVQCQVVAGDVLYFGTAAGKVMEADTGGNDDGMQITAHYVPKSKTYAEWQEANSAALIYKAPEELDFDLDCHADYTVDPLSIPATTATTTTTTWGSGTWGTFVWGDEGANASFTNWQTVNNSGYALAPSVSITVNQSARVNMEILGMRLRTEAGNAL